MSSSPTLVLGPGRSRVPRWLRRIALFLLALVLLGAAYPLWKPLVRTNRWFVIASNITFDSMRRLGLRSDQIDQTVFAAPPDSEIAPQIARMRSVYDQYLRY